MIENIKDCVGKNKIWKMNKKVQLKNKLSKSIKNRKNMFQVK